MRRQKDSPNKLSPALETALKKGNASAIQTISLICRPLIQSITQWDKWEFSESIRHEVEEEIESLLVQAMIESKYSHEDLSDHIRLLCIRCCLRKSGHSFPDNSHPAT